ncbi:MAG: protein translocase subunit SecF [Methylacidiphilales bacterium]|nr:protein translocase subunit SecF [Candidatus Methylacidiphilales bacterium]
MGSIKMKQINFFKFYIILVAISTMVILASFSLIMMGKLNLGIEFTGGYLIEVSSDSTINTDILKEKIEKSGLAVSSIQYLDDTRHAQIRLFPVDDPQKKSDQSSVNNYVLSTMSNIIPNITKSEFIGPSVGETLKFSGSIAFIASLVSILLYLLLRFNLILSISAIISLLHDASVVLLFFLLTKNTFDLNVLAAILAIMGYSLNDNIVIYDRFRSNCLIHEHESIKSIFNLSINQMLKRTILTSGVTMLSVLSLYFIGGVSLKEFSLALIVGIITGTYSTIYIASGLAILFGAQRIVSNASTQNEDNDYYLKKFSK